MAQRRECSPIGIKLRITNDLLHGKLSENIDWAKIEIKDLKGIIACMAIKLLLPVYWCGYKCYDNI